MATFQRSDRQAGSRYVTGGTVDVKGNKLGWWERKKFPTSQTDVEYIITAKYAHRPDLLAFDLYGKPSLQWFIMQYNNIVDLYDDFNEGKRLLLPTKSRLFGELLSNS